MVKKWITMVSLMIILVAGCVIESIYINKSFKWLINNLETLQIELKENKEKCDSEELIYKANQVHIKWAEKTKVLKCLIWHSGIKDIETGLARVAVYVEENDYKEASAELSALIDYCAHYVDDFHISIENVF